MSLNPEQLAEHRAQAEALRSPTYNHTRGDSALTPCPDCAVQALDNARVKMVAAVLARANADMERIETRDNRGWDVGELLAPLEDDLLLALESLRPLTARWRKGSNR